MTNLFQVILSLLNSEDLLTQYQGVYGLDLFVILGIVSRVALSAFQPVALVQFASSSIKCFLIFSLSFLRSLLVRCSLSSPPFL